MRVAMRVTLAVAGLGVASSPVGAQRRAPFVPTAASVERVQPGIDILGYDITLTVAPPSARIEGTEVITLVRRAKVVQLRLDAVGLAISRVLVGTTPVSVQTLDSAIVVPLDRATGDSISVTVSWSASPADGLVIRDGADGWTAFGDNFPDRARLWLPVVDHPSDKATVAWTVRAPVGYLVVANGARQGVDTVRGTPDVARWRFRQAQAIPTYLMVIGVGRLEEVSLGETACGFGPAGGCVPQSVLVTPSLRASMPGTFAQAGEIVRFFASLFGPFPYDRLSHVQSRTRFGGMENAGAIFYAWNIFGSGKPFPAGLIAHETAHQWFGDAVTERAWAHAWLSEGFATYLAAMYAEHVGGDSALRVELTGMRAAIMKSPASRDRPVIDTAQTVLLQLLNTNSYQKGGHVLHMLRREIGDSAFVKAIRDYQAEFRHSNAMTSDLARAVARASGRDLQWFFDQWLTRPGWADVEVQWRVSGSQLRLSVLQPGPAAPYRLTLPVDVELSDGRVVHQRVVVDAASRGTHPVQLPAGAVVRAVRADPQGDLLATIRVTALPPE